MAGVGSEAWARTYFGPPCISANLVGVKMFGRTLSVHRKAARVFRRIDRVFKDKCPDYYKIICREADTGTYNCRKIAGSNYYSNHAFGLAIDIDWQSNMPDGDRNSRMRDLGMAAVRKLEHEGLVRWGGRYANPDDMHLEVVAPPNKIRQTYTRGGRLKTHR